MTPAPTDPVEIVRQHHSLHRTLREILAELDWMNEHPDRVGESWDMPVIIEGFRDAARDHFAFEEEGGPLEAGLADSKEATVARSLIEEHRMIDARLCRLIAEMDGVRMPERSVQQCFDQEIRSVINLLLEHETRERALFSRISNVHG